MTLPNAITLARLLAVPATVWLVVRGWYDAALWLFLLAGLSDAVDGWLARRLGQVSRLGSLLDPVADKALLVSVFISLGVRDLLPAWLVILVVFRDALIVSGWLLGQMLMPSAQPVRPHWTSKLNTCVQLAFAAGVLAIFNAVVRVADATGIPLEEQKAAMSADFRGALGINDYPAAAGKV